MIIYNLYKVKLIYMKIQNSNIKKEIMNFKKKHLSYYINMKKGKD